MLEIGSLVNNKYKIINWLGEGGMAKTYLAIDPDDKDKQLVVKVVQLKGLKEWKMLELFKREANILKSLNHPKIPKYIDYFVEEQEDNIMYFLVYEYIEGESLNSFLDKGKIFSYEVVGKMMKQILEILVYLHDIVPPVVHRDINPNNIIRKDNGDVYLVDFGAVQDTIIKNTKLGGSTFVGTYGYIPLEQLSGKATPQSDLYALGMSAIKLLTGKSPHTFEMSYLKPTYKNKDDYNGLDKIIDIMIEPAVENRVKTSGKVLYIINSYLSNYNLIEKNDKDYEIKQNKEDYAYMGIKKSELLKRKPRKKLIREKNEILDYNLFVLKGKHTKDLRLKKHPNKLTISLTNTWNLNTLSIIYSKYWWVLMFLGGFLLPSIIDFALLFLVIPVMIMLISVFAGIKFDEKEQDIITIFNKNIYFPRQIFKMDFDEIDTLIITKKRILKNFSLKLTITSITGELKTVTIPNVHPFDANYISDFINNNIKPKTKLIKDNLSQE